MKKILFVLISILLLAMLLTACAGGVAQAGDSVESAEGNSLAMGESAGTPAPGDGFGGALSESTQLILGTLKLDETDNAVDSQQAAALLLLWKAVRSLSESDTAAQAEVDALYSQIRGTMTSEQLEAIAAMEFTRQDMATIAEELGLEIAAGGFGGEIDPEMQATMQAARESGQGPPEGFTPGTGPGGGQGPGGGFRGEEMTPEERETTIAERGGARSMNSAMDAVFIGALIEMLETLALGS